MRTEDIPAASTRRLREMLSTPGFFTVCIQGKSVGLTEEGNEGVRKILLEEIERIEGIFGKRLK